MANAPNAEPPAAVLVITVWADAGDVRRTVSVGGPVDAPGGVRAPLRRLTVRDDDGVVDIVRSWLATVAGGEERGGKDAR